jgi:hypothetical protein
MPDASTIPTIDPAAAQKAFTALRSRLLDLAPAEILPVNIDLQKAAIAALAVGRWVKEPELRARFRKLPESEFQQAYVDDLETIALAALHVSVELLTASAASTEAKLPGNLVEEATTLKQRMLRLVEYHFGDDPEDGLEIASIKLGAGYPDLASDLLRLAKLYKKRHAEVELDPKHYLATDRADAQRAANAILALLGAAKNQDQKAWSDLAARSFTFLLRAYGEVSAAGRFLYRNDEAEARFPSLYAAARPNIGRARRAKSSEERASDPSPSDPG